MTKPTGTQDENVKSNAGKSVNVRDLPGDESTLRGSKVHWDGSVTLVDPVAYFGANPGVRKHLNFLDRHKKRLRKVRQIQARRAAAIVGAHG